MGEVPLFMGMRGRNISLIDIVNTPTVYRLDLVYMDTAQLIRASLFGTSRPNCKQFPNIEECP